MTGAYRSVWHRLPFIEHHNAPSQLNQTPKILTAQQKRRAILVVWIALAATFWWVYQLDQPLWNFTQRATVSAVENDPNIIPLGKDREQPATTTLAALLQAPHTLEELQTAATSAIEERQRALTVLQQFVANHPYLDSGAKQQLNAELSTTNRGFIELNETIGQATEENEQLRTNIAAITDTYPVFSIILPQVQGLAVIATDLRAVRTGTQTATKLDTLIGQLQGQAVDTSQLATFVAAYHAALAESTALLQQAQTAFLAIDGTASAQNRTNRDAGLQHLARASKVLGDAKELLSVTITPLAKQLIK